MSETGDEGGSEGEMGDMLDPSMIESGGGQGQGNLALGMMIPGAFGKSKLSSLEVQTSAAFQELGFVIGVAIVVALLFLLLVYTEKLGTCVVDKIHTRFGNKPKDEEDPAALVGTFKLNKN